MGLDIILMECIVYVQLTSQSIAPTANISSASATTPPMNMPEIKRIDDMYIAEVVINDIPLGCRNYLTRLTTQVVD